MEAICRVLAAKDTGVGSFNHEEEFRLACEELVSLGWRQVFRLEGYETLPSGWRDPLTGKDVAGDIECMQIAFDRYMSAPADPTPHVSSVGQYNFAVSSAQTVGQYNTVSNGYGFGLAGYGPDEPEGDP